MGIRAALHTPADIELLAEVDTARATLSVRRYRNSFSVPITISGDLHFICLAELSVAQL